MRRLNTKHAIQIRYEDLALNPEKVMKNVSPKIPLSNEAEGLILAVLSEAFSKIAKLAVQIV